MQRNPFKHHRFPPVVCLMSHSLVVTMSQQPSLFKSGYLDP